MGKKGKTNLIVWNEGKERKGQDHILVYVVVENFNSEFNVEIRRHLCSMIRLIRF